MILLRKTPYMRKTKSHLVQEQIDDVCMSVEELVDVNVKINPILNSLKEVEFFRIFKVNLENECPFWEAIGN